MTTIHLLRGLQLLAQHSDPALCKEGQTMSRKKAGSKLFSDSVTKEISPEFSQLTDGTVPDAVLPRPVQLPLQLEWALDPNKGKGLSERVLARLLLAEAKSGDYDSKLAYRLAWHIVLHCMKGDAVQCSPVTLSYYTVVECHEDRYYDRVIQRRRAMLGQPISIASKRKSSPALPHKLDEEKSA